MLSRLREHLGSAGLIVAIVALVAALGGGAYAASGGSGGGKATASAKQGKQGKQGKTGPAGPAGPAGPTGPTGPAGPAGSTGAKGDTGAPGAAGAVGATGAAGAKGTTGAAGPAGAAGPTGPAGADGSPWVVGTAPSGAILKGTWSLPPAEAAAEDDEFFVPISTGVPLPVTVNTNPVVVSVDPGGDGSAFGCNGSVENPTIEPKEFLEGVVCLYEAAATNVKPALGPAASLLKESGGGVVARFQSAGSGEVSAYGTWVLQVP
jgi:hypothetical protein